MTEYIDREKLLRDIEHYNVSDGAFQHWVEIQRAADVALVRHGRWIKENSRKKSYLWICSNCRKIAYFCGGDGKCAYQYCPNCGARMDGAE